MSLLNLTKLNDTYNLKVKGVAHFGAHTGEEVEEYKKLLFLFKKNNLNVDPYLKNLKQKTISIEEYIQPQSAYLYKWRILLHEIIGYYTYQAMGYI